MIEKLEAIAGSYESAIKAAEHKAAMKTFNQRVASGEVKPAKRADISDEYIIEMYNNNVSAYKIAQSVGMTQQAILYRIKKLKEAGLIE
jgi:predicted transcriptional regulator